eukprot:CAMPEP_0196591364 /NCGR_PEP_ID=MMETSP1081-20130531/69334_1 /TAXON_ID=36882 /ORGANISM="Pyramimonas amylifera, Strain CCMP720" /LENGTH=240 /DNA_ID=CAMNT_0041914699 /DNA_START=112 /DNA_END=835 /DNA_ORIENTATION=-
MSSTVLVTVQPAKNYGGNIVSMKNPDNSAYQTVSDEKETGLILSEPTAASNILVESETSLLHQNCSEYSTNRLTSTEKQGGLPWSESPNGPIGLSVYIVMLASLGFLFILPGTPVGFWVAVGLLVVISLGFLFLTHQTDPGRIPPQPLPDPLVTAVESGEMEAAAAASGVAPTGSGCVPPLDKGFLSLGALFQPFLKLRKTLSVTAPLATSGGRLEPRTAPSATSASRGSTTTAQPWARV